MDHGSKTMFNKIAKKITGLLFLLLVLPIRAGAVNITNPARGFFIDLTDRGRTNTFPDLFLFLIEIFLGVVALLAIAFIIIGGAQYIMSRGDAEMAENGKKTLFHAIIGLIIVILSYMIVVVIINALRGSP